MGDDRATVYYDPTVKSWVYRASSSGQCVRAMVAAAMGEKEVRGKERQELMSRSADEGVLHEPAIVEDLKKVGWVFVTTQETVTMKVLPGVIIRGHTDGRAVAPSGFIYEGGGYSPAGDFSGVEHGVEIKTMSTKQFAKWTSGKFRDFAGYAAQLTSYMEGTGLPFLYVVKRREDGMMSTVRVETPPVPFSVIKKKIIVAEKYRRRNEAKKGTEWPTCDVSTYGCPFFYLHDEDQVSLVAEELNEDEQRIVDDLTDKFLMWKRVEEAGKDAEGKRKAIQKEILNMMGDRKVVKATGETGGLVVTKSNGGGSTLDEAGLRAKVGDAVVDSFKRKYSYEYVTIKEER